MKSVTRSHSIIFLKHGATIASEQSKLIRGASSVLPVQNTIDGFASKLLALEYKLRRRHPLCFLELRGGDMIYALLFSWGIDGRRARGRTKMNDGGATDRRAAQPRWDIDRA